MDMTRRNFVGSLVATMAIPAIGKKDDWFEDIQVDRYYVLKGGPYGSTGGVGMPGVAQGPELIEMMDWEIYNRNIDCWLNSVCGSGFYFEAYQYFGPNDAKRYNDIKLTRDWMLEFYNRHKNETKEDWEKKYGDYLESLHWPKASLSKFGTLTI